MGKREYRVLSRAAEQFDLPEDLVAGLPYIELLGDRELLLDHHRGILSYSSEEMDINTGSMVLRLRGRNLQLLSMTENALRIGGEIDGLELIK